MFHSHCISVHKLLYCSFFSASFCMKFLSVSIATSISMHVFSLLFLIIISALFAVISLPVCTHWFYNTVTYCSHTGVGVCVLVCHLSVILILRLCIVSNANVLKLLCLITYSFFAKMRYHKVRRSVVPSCYVHNWHSLSNSSFKILLLLWLPLPPPLLLLLLLPPPPPPPPLMMIMVRSLLPCGMWHTTIWLLQILKIWRNLLPQYLASCVTFNEGSGFL